MEGKSCELLRLRRVLRLSQSSLRFGRHSAPFRGSAIVPTRRLSFLSRAPKRWLSPCIEEHHTGQLRWSASLKLRIFSPLFTPVRARVIPRTSPLRSSTKFIFGRRVFIENSSSPAKY